MPGVFPNKHSPGEMNCCCNFNGDWEPTQGVSRDPMCLKYFIMVVVAAQKLG